MLSGVFGILMGSQDLPWDFTGFLGSQWDLMDIQWDFKWCFRDSLGFLRISRIFITWWDSFLIKTTPTPPPPLLPSSPPSHWNIINPSTLQKRPRRRRRIHFEINKRGGMPRPRRRNRGKGNTADAIRIGDTFTAIDSVAVATARLHHSTPRLLPASSLLPSS